MTRRLFLPLALLLASVGFRASAQSTALGNEWIDFTKTYIKIKFGPGGTPALPFANSRPKDAILRVSKGGLDQVGIPAGVTGASMSVWRDGKEIPIYVTTNGVFGTSDYIEFYGEHADGRLDSLLYDNPDNLPNPNISLFTDTAVYFLTWDNGTPSSHLRFTQVPNNIPATPPAALTYCWGLASLNYKGASNYLPGDFTAGRSKFYSSNFTAAEGYIFNYRTPPAVASFNFPTPEAASVPGVNAKVTTTVLTMSAGGNTSQFTISLNGTQIADSSWGNIATAHFHKEIASSELLPTGNNAFLVDGGAAGSGLDYYGVSRIQIEYPRSFAVNAAPANVGYFEFTLDASSTPQYIEITSFVNGANVPRLYDVPNRKYYLGDISQAGKVRFYLEPSVVKRKLVMYSDNNTSNLMTLIPDKKVQFTDYSLPTRQGDYMIITSNKLEAITNGHNYVQDYVDYRKSIAGGSHNVAKVDAEDLYDQYAYGVYLHPLAVQRFVRYAYDNWTLKPDYLYLIGRGLAYHEYRNYANNPTTYTFPVVPTYGFPGSDVAFSNFLPGRKQALKTGRLSVWNPTEIGTYLDKLKAYEQNLAANPALPDLESELWKKRVVHIAGGSDTLLQKLVLLPNLKLGENEIVKPCYGGQVTTFAKSSTDPVEQAENVVLDDMIEDGIAILTFHGHASQNTFDYNLNDPGKYNNAPKMPLFIALGCDVAQMFSLDEENTITEKWVLQPNGGAICMIASDNVGYTDWHPRYLPAIYNGIATSRYGMSIGEQHRAAYDSLMSAYWDGSMSGGSGSNYAHLESMLLIGDPAVHLPAPPLPDYYVGAEGLSATPQQVTSDDDSFKMRIITYNLGKARCGGSDSVTVRVEHITPGGTVSAIGSYRVSTLKISDTNSLYVMVDGFTDLGLNRYRVTVDADEQDAETSEANNVAYLDLFIASDRLMPIYPKEFAIIYQQGVTLKASTLDPFRPSGRYRFQIDTTALFNSAKFREHLVEGPGGVVRWQPDNFVMEDSMVYYWRTAVDTSNGQNLQWTTSSFVFLQNGTPGWNQSHYYQWLRDSYTNLTLQSSDRQFVFPPQENVLEIRNTVSYQSSDGSFTNIFLNGTLAQTAGQDVSGSIQIMVINPLSGAVWTNTPTSYKGTVAPVLYTYGIFTTEFNLDDSSERQRAANYLDSIPNGYYVAIKNYVTNAAYAGTTVTDLQNDATYFPAATTLYSRLRNDFGFDLIDQYIGKKAFIFWRRKGAAFDATKQQYMNSGLANDNMIKTFNFLNYPDTGILRSTVIGPALEWKTMRTKRFTNAPNVAANDDAPIRVSGITAGNVVVPLFTTRSTDTSIAAINAAQYPNLRLEWLASDTVDRSSPQQRYWQVLYSPVPEAALNPGAYFSLTDSTSTGQTGHIGVGIENLTEIPMDSMLVRYRVINNGGGLQDLAYKRFRKLPGNDTLHAELDFAPDAFIGRNLLFIEVNPDNDQPEQYHPNNLGYVPFRVGQDLLNPLLDVTFDGTHILNRDIVSSKPFIKILMRDENKFMPLDDTSLMSVQLRYPGAAGQTVEIPFDNNIMKFYPAQASGSNEARIEFRPTLTQDGIYELIVNGKDKSGNAAGKASYRTEFEVVNKSTITNVLNYPNPFSTATSFVFTLTGSQVPSQFKIQILSMTGKVVREITRDEIGPIHVGRNMTEYRWDGKDQYGQMLGNGVYLYRVVTSINGQDIEQRNSGADKFFKNGYGKLYIMR